MVNTAIDISSRMKDVNQRCVMYQSMTLVYMISILIALFEFQ